VRTQIWIDICSYVLVAILKKHAFYRETTARKHTISLHSEGQAVFSLTRSIWTGRRTTVIACGREVARITSEWLLALSKAKWSTATLRVIGLPEPRYLYDRDEHDSCE
jgi:hypothetical protein